MQELVFTALVPHPPILVPEVGQEHVARVRATHHAMEGLAADLVKMAPDVVVVISPHGPVFQDAIAVHMLESIGGNLGAFGAPQVAFSVSVDRDLGDLVIKGCRDLGVPTAPVTEEWAEEWEAQELDHGTMVPLYFLNKAGWMGPVLPIAIGMLPPVQLYAFGQALQQAIDETDRRVAVLASGDLSHRLTPDAPDGYDPTAREFDREVVEALGRGDLLHVFQMEHGKCQRAASCALRPLMMLAGVLDGIEIKPQVLSYEGPFGVGYSVVEFRPGGEDPSRQYLPRLQGERRASIEKRRTESHAVAALARQALELYVKTGLELDFSAGAPHEGTAPWQLPVDLPERAGVFVSLKVDGELRGCMGTYEPHEPTLALEIVRVAIMAGTEDSRFQPVEEEELADLDYSVDILWPTEPCSIEQLDPQTYGVIVSKGDRAGLLLPALPGVDSAREQVKIACSKAGLDPEDPGLQVRRFRVTRLT